MVCAFFRAEVVRCLQQAVDTVLFSLDPRRPEERKLVSSATSAALRELVTRLPMASFHKVPPRLPGHGPCLHAPRHCAAAQAWRRSWLDS